VRSDKGLRATLEMAGVLYTGSSPLGHGLALDKVITKRLIRGRGVADAELSRDASRRREARRLAIPTTSEAASRIRQLRIAVCI